MSNYIKAVLAMILSSLSFAVMGAFIKLSGDIPVVQKSIFRTIIVMVISYILMRKNGLKIRSIKPSWWLFSRCFFGTVSMWLHYYAIDRLVLSDSSIVFKLSSVFVLLLSVVLLKERITRYQIFWVLAAFAGLFFIVRPSFESSLADYGVALLGMLTASMAYTSLRPLRNMNSNLVVFAFALFNTIAFAPMLLANPSPMTSGEVFYSVVGGLFAAAGQYGITIAYKYAPAAKVAIFNYSGVLFSAVISIVFFKQAPAAVNYIGYAVILGSAYMLHRYNIKAERGLG